jgi:O-antigen/teichoic acid export membrane protein
MANSVTQNTSFLTAASLLQKVISSVYFFVVAHYIGEEITGDYFNIFASIAIFIISFYIHQCLGLPYEAFSKNHHYLLLVFLMQFYNQLICNTLVVL